MYAEPVRVKRPVTQTVPLQRVLPPPLSEKTSLFQGEGKGQGRELKALASPRLAKAQRLAAAESLAQRCGNRQTQKFLAQARTKNEVQRSCSCGQTQAETKNEKTRPQKEDQPEQSASLQRCACQNNEEFARDLPVQRNLLPLQREIAPHPLLKKGSSGPAVAEAQEKLNSFNTQQAAQTGSGFAPVPLTPDGLFGAKTKSAVISFQQQRFPGQPNEHDGIIGQKTWAELDQVGGGSSASSSQPSPGGNTNSCAAGQIPVNNNSALSSDGGTGSQCIPATDYGSRVKNVSMVRLPPAGLSQEYLFDLILNNKLAQPMAAQGSATVVGDSELDKFKFGVIQLCRKLAVYRATYHSAKSGQDYVRDATNEMRQKEPLQDTHEGSIWSVAQPETPSKANRTVKTLFTDTPDIPFAASQSVVGDQGVDKVNLSGAAFQNFYFTAFAVQFPDGKLKLLKSFYWEMKYCEKFDPSDGNPLDHSLGKKVEINAGDIIDGAPAEPGTDKLENAPTETCNAHSKNVIKSKPIEGPGQFTVEC
jgi:peptidoglycan hydrolase-like protein with peptidoglycan-binding domain